MRDRRRAPGPRRSRRTTAVGAHRLTRERWWAASTPSFGPKPAEIRQWLQFRSDDPLEGVARLRYVLVLVALLMPVLFLGRVDAVRTAVSKMLRNPESHAMECLANGQTGQAAASLRAAVAANPGDPVLLRQFAIASAALLPGEARRCYNQLEKMGVSTDADRARHSMLLAALKDFTGAKALLLKISPNARVASQTQLAWLALWKSAGDFASAADALERLLASAGSIEVSACLDLVEEAGRTPVEPATLDRLENLTAQSLAASGLKGDAAQVQSVASRIASIPWHTMRSRLEVSKVLRNLPGNPPEFRLAAARLGFPAKIDTAERQSLRSAWLEEITSVGGLSAEDKNRVAAYLQKQNEHELVAELVPVAESFTEYPLFVRRIESLLELGRWREVGAMCADPGAPALHQLRLLTQSMSVLHKPGPQTCMAGRLLLDAFNESREEKNAAACFATGCAALDHRLTDLAGNAFAVALDCAKDRRPTMEAIINSSRHGGLSVAQLLHSLESTSAFSDESVQNRLIYLHLLAHHDVDRMSRLIQQRRLREPEDVYLRFLESFARHLNGDYAQAAKMLVPLPRYRWHQGEAAVIAGIVVAAGGFDRSAGLISKISLDDIFPEERSMAEPWQQRLRTGTVSLLSKADVSESQ